MESHNKPTETTEESPNTMPSSSPFNSFKSKKILRSNSKPASSEPSDPNTPMKAMQLRSRNRGVVFSVNQMKKAAQGLNKSKDLVESSTTSSKKSQISPKKGKESIKLPESYELLAKFFDNMQSTIRLLTLKAKRKSFSNICPGVESLSDRRFSYTHLAQMKYILPEAIELKKVTLVDEKTTCTKSDLEVILLPDAIESDGKGKGKSASGYCNLSKVFRTRLLDFNKTHPEGREIPVGELPEPFNTRVQNDVLSSKQNCISSLPVHLSSDALPQQNTFAASHLSLSFKSRFTQKSPMSDSEKTQLLSSTLSSPSQPEEAASNVQPIENTSILCVVPVSGSPRQVEISDEEIEVTKSRDCFCKDNSQSEMTSAKDTFTSKPVSSTPTRPVKNSHEYVEVVKNKDCSLKVLQSEKTPAKLTSTPARLMTLTPALQTPKRCHIIQDDASTPSPNKLVRRPPKRPLFNTPVKNRQTEVQKKETHISSTDAYLINLLPETLRHSLIEKEKQSTKEQNIAISQAKRRRQMIASLPKLFNMIHLMFQSVKGGIVTKEELMHKIFTSHLDIIDRAELEEQLKLLKELVPDWIQEKVASSGDLLMRINKQSCPDSVRLRLTEAL